MHNGTRRAVQPQRRCLDRCVPPTMTVYAAALIDCKQEALNLLLLPPTDTRDKKVGKKDEVRRKWRKRWT
eukprot:1150651-Prymnesium_polylepis.2